MIAGVDGCKKGWVIAMAHGWPCADVPRLAVVPDFRSVLEATSGCDMVVVDMPIGLAAGRPTDSGFRTCDEAARQSMGAAGSSRVFNAPPRGTLTATKVEHFQQLHRSLTGAGAGLPVWGIVDKLLDVDRAMAPDVQARVKEFHPELAWKRLAGRVLDSKHSALGLVQRMAVLKRELAALDRIGDWPDQDALARADLDDVLDALVGLPVAEAVRAGQEDNRIPVGPPAADARGLRMEIWF